MNLQYVTLTGLDDHTDLSKIWRLSKLYPFVEWGVLYTKTPEGRARYPSIAKIREIGLFFQEYNIKGSLHLCGSVVYDLLDHKLNEHQKPLRGYKRIQLNFNHSAKPVDSQALVRLMHEYSRPFITQYNDNNQGFFVPADVKQHHVLMDSSAGTGKPIEKLLWLPDKSLCGYAGGIGPDNVEDKLAQIFELLGTRPFWIDMESSLRVDDRFSVSVAEDVLAKAARKLGDLSWIKKAMDNFTSAVEGR